MDDAFSLHPSYLLSEIRQHYDDPTWWRVRVHERINGPVQQRFRPPSKATNVLKEEWDTLVVLDACRGDLFEEYATEVSDVDPFDGRRIAVSNASSTPEWLHRTFGEAHGEIVYVSGNPMVTRHKATAFHRLDEVWREAYDPRTSVIDPGAVTDRARTAREAFPDKRLIVHYMQPHYPFIDRPELNFARYEFDDVGLEASRESGPNPAVTSVWEALAAGLVDRETVWEGYKHTLAVVMEEVRTLLEAIEDRVVVTSDHGNMLGERNWPVPIRTYGHPNYLRNVGLIHVPWCVRDGPRRDIVDDGAASTAASTDAEVTERLSNLGYAD